MVWTVVWSDHAWSRGQGCGETRLSVVGRQGASNEPGRGHTRLRQRRQAQIVKRVPSADLIPFTCLGEPLRRVFADDVQHLVTALGVIAVKNDKALVDQGADALERVSDLIGGPAHPRYRVQIPATRERGEPAEECRLPGPEQVVAPGPRACGRCLPRAGRLGDRASDPA